MMPTSATRTRSCDRAPSGRRAPAAIVVVVEVAGGEGEHAQPSLGQLPGWPPSRSRRGPGRSATCVAVPQRLAAAVDDDVGRALDAHEVRLVQDARRASDSGRSWNVAMNLYSESNGTSARRGSARRVSSASTPILAASTTSAASVGSPMIDSSSATVASLHSARPSARPVEVGCGAAGGAEDGARLLVAAALDLVPVAAGEHRGRRHGVHRQRAGLVAVDDRRAAERLDVGQRLDDRLGLGQPLRTRRRASSARTSASPVGMAEIAVETHSRTSVSVSWPRAMPEDGDHRHRRPGEDAEDLGQAVELALQRRRGTACVARDHVGDAAHLRRLRRWPSRRTIAEPRVTWVFWKTRFVRSPSAVSRSASVDGVLGDRGALAGERRLLHLERRRRR